MIIGLTYDLRKDWLAEGYSEEETAEFDKEDTIEALETALAGLGHIVERIGHFHHLLARLAEGRRWELVFNICEGMHGLSRESQVPAVLEAFRIPFVFSDPVTLGLSLHKGFTKHVVRGLGVPTPDFRVVDSEAEAVAVDLPFPLFAKPVAEGTGKGIAARSKITNPQSLREVCRQLRKQFRQPVLVETYLPGREFTVGLVGTGEETKALGVMEVVMLEQAEAHAYSYSNKENYLDRVRYRLATDETARLCTEFACRAWRGLGCRDGGRMDFRADAAGIPNFMEVNPLAGLHPVHSDLPILCGLLGIGYQELIGRILNSAVLRLAGETRA